MATREDNEILDGMIDAVTQMSGKLVLIQFWPICPVLRRQLACLHLHLIDICSASPEWPGGRPRAARDGRRSTIAVVYSCRVCSCMCVVRGWMC